MGMSVRSVAGTHRRKDAVRRLVIGLMNTLGVLASLDMYYVLTLANVFSTR